MRKHKLLWKEDKNIEMDKVNATSDEPPSSIGAQNENSESSRSSRKRNAPADEDESESVDESGIISNSKKRKVSSSKVFVIGENCCGQLGFGEEVDVKTIPTLLELPYSITNIAAGGFHSVCLTENGEVLTFGCNDEGALGRVIVNASDEANPGKVAIPGKVIQISAGDSHTAALTESGKVYLWGNFRCGDGSMGLTLAGEKEEIPIQILTEIKIIKISSGTEHLACLSDEGIVYTCGCGENGELGRLSQVICPDCKEKKEGTWNRSAEYLNVAIHEIRKRIHQFITWLVDKGFISGTVRIFGQNYGLERLLEQPCIYCERMRRIVMSEPSAVFVKDDSKPVLIEDIWTSSYSTFLKAQETGRIYVFGLNNYNQLGYENERAILAPKQVASFNGKTWQQITGGQHHTLCLDSEGRVYSMGREHYGRLGLGDNSGEKSSPTLISALENVKSKHISCGDCVSFAVTEEGSLYSWGFGANYQLGHENDDDCYVPRLVEGDFKNSWKALKVSGGGQHTLVLATPIESDIYPTEYLD